MNQSYGVYVTQHTWFKNILVEHKEVKENKLTYKPGVENVMPHNYNCYLQCNDTVLNNTKH